MNHFVLTRMSEEDMQTLRAVLLFVLSFSPRAR